MRWAGHVACMREWKGAYRTLVEKTEGKRTLGRHRCRSEDHIKMDLLEEGLRGGRGPAGTGLTWLMTGRGGGLL